MPRVLFVTQTHNIWGGMEQWLHNFSAWLQDNVGRASARPDDGDERRAEARPTWEVLAALPRGGHFNDAYAYLRAHDHLKPIILDVRAGSARGRLQALTNAIVDSRADLVIPIASGTIFEAMRHARARGFEGRLIVPVRSLHPDLFCNLVDHADVVDRVVGVSRLIKALLREMLPGQHVDYVRHGVRPAVAGRGLRVASEPARADTTPATSNQQPATAAQQPTTPDPQPATRNPPPLRVGFVGRLEQSTKRVFDLAAIDADLHIFGGGPDERELRERLPNATFHGVLSQEDLYERAYPNLDVLLLFSTTEGSPNAVYEAMQHGVVPVISRFLGQASEGIVRDGETGFTFDVGDVASAALAIERLDHDRELLESLSRAAQAEVANDTDERMHRDWERILRAALAIPPKKSNPPLPIPPSGMMDRLLPTAVADLLRRLIGREFRHDDGWGEWPGTAPASRACIERVERRLRELDSGSDQ
jgi:glycosyltransferase involved in cell wall biosynthesis